MERKHELDKARRVKIDVPFSDLEAEEFRSFIQSTRRRQGAWVRDLILEAMRKVGSK